MPRAPRGKRIVNESTGAVTVANKAPNGSAEPYFDRTREVWVAPWRRRDGKVGRPTGRTRALAEASRDRHIAAANDSTRLSRLAEGFHTDSTLADLMHWWLDHIARHRVRATTLATYRKQLSLVEVHLGDVRVRALRPEQITTFISGMIDSGSASRARNVRTLLVQVLDQAVVLGLASENVAKKVRPPRVPRVQRRTLTPTEVGRLLAAADERFVAAIALCYVQGWRISEALGLAWQDVDLENGVVTLRRGATYADGVGMVLGPTKTTGTAGRQFLGPTVCELLRRKRTSQLAHRLVMGDAWPVVTYEGATLDLVFTTVDGKPMLRQHVDRAIRLAAVKAGFDPAGLGTHTGRRSVVTNLFASGSLGLEDVARFVGHSDVATTRGYVQHEGNRPQLVSEKAFQLLDPNWPPVAISGR